MKNFFIYRLTALASVSVASVALVSCDTMNAPLGGSGYNPLDPPGGMLNVQEDPYGVAFTPGSFLQTVSPTTAFFNNFPSMEEQPNKVLPDYTDVKIISTKGSYVKVEVVDTGAVGYVPSIMLGEKRSPNEIPVTPGVGEIQVTPDLLPEPQVLSDLPSVAPEPEIPGIQPPEIVDPSQPAE